MKRQVIVIGKNRYRKGRHWTTIVAYEPYECLLCCTDEWGTIADLKEHLATDHPNFEDYMKVEPNPKGMKEVNGE